MPRVTKRKRRSPAPAKRRRARRPAYTQETAQREREAAFVQLLKETGLSAREAAALLEHEIDPRRRASKNPRGYKRARRFTRAASSAKKQRQWKHVYRGARERGYGERRAIIQASGVVARNPLRKRYIVELLHRDYGLWFLKAGDQRGKPTTQRRERAQVFHTEKEAAAAMHAAHDAFPARVRRNFVWMRTAVK